MRDYMWDEQAGTFLAVKRDSREKIRVATISSWIPLTAGVPTAAMAGRMADVLSTPAWQTPLPVPTVDRSDKRWKPSAFWRGDVWPPTNYQIASGLAAYGHKELAADICDKTIANAIPNGISERYDSVTGKALGVPDYCMSSTLVTMMLDGITKEHRLRLRGKETRHELIRWAIMKSTHKPDEPTMYSMKFQAVVFTLVFALANGLAASEQVMPPLLGNRFLTFNTVVRVRQIEVTRDTAHGPDESSVHTSAEARIFREAIADAWPGACITWAFSWKALHDERQSYRQLRGLVVSYHKKFGDEITFIPGAYFANMYNTRGQVNRDLHEGLQRVSEVVGDGYRPKSVVAGFLSAANLRYLAEEEGIHVCQGNIWSQYAVDNGDGEGSICYPYYPSREHFCKPARGKDDFIDCVNLDGWTIDFLCARIPGARTVNGERWRSRQGVGPIETLLDMGTERGLQAMLATTATHFDNGFARNGFAWVTCGWEMSLVEARKIYGYGGRNGMEGLHLWLTEIRKRWPDARLITQGQFGELWRAQFKNNDGINYRFVHRGCGIRASEADKEIRWFMNKDFRLALLRNWKENLPEKVIDFTRYDLPAAEPADPEPGKHSRNWSLLNRINQKGTRPQDQPIPLAGLTEEERALIRSHYPELMEPQ